MTAAEAKKELLQQELQYRMMERDCLYWLQNLTKTENKHWKREKLEHLAPFPRYPFLPWLFGVFQDDAEKVVLIKKSRDMMTTWCAAGFATWFSETTAGVQVIVQSQKEDKANEVIDYCRTLYRNQPEWLQERCPLAMEMKRQPLNSLRWANGSEIIGIPEGKDQIRSYHPTLYIGDEAAFQPEAGESYDTALSSCQKVLMISTANAGWYSEFTDEHSGKADVLRGIQIWRNAKGLLVCRVHYSAIPERDPSTPEGSEWYAREKKNYSSDSRWDQEQEIVDGAGGGDLVLAEAMRENRDLIVIDCADYTPNPLWIGLGGFDYGKKNPTAFEVLCIDEEGDYVALQEHYRSGLSPSEHAAIMRTMRYYEWVQRIYADVSIFGDAQAQADGSYRLVSEMFYDAGVTKFVAGPKTKGGDLQVSERILEMWRQRPPRFKICVPKGMYEEPKKREGTYAFGCPNLWWELSQVRRKELSAIQLMSANPTEQLVQKHNHAFDAVKYVMLANPVAPNPSEELEWALLLKDRRDRQAPMDENTLHKLWQIRQKAIPPKEESWR